MSSKVHSVVVSGKAEYTFSGPKDSNTTFGASRTTSFTATSGTGATGDFEDEYEMQFGGRSELFHLGRHQTTIVVGSYNVLTMQDEPTSVGPGSGITLSTSASPSDNTLELGVSSASLTANVGNATLQATKGSAYIKGTAGVTVESTVSVTLQAALVQVNLPTTFAGGVLTDGCINPLTGTTYALSGSLGVPNFQVANF